MREVAKVLHVATSTVYQLCAEGKLAHVRISNAIRISGGALADYLGAHGTGSRIEGPGGRIDEPN